MITAEMLREAMAKVEAEPYRPFVPVISPYARSLIKAEQRPGETELEAFYRLAGEGK